jgi:hypothetical protein
MIRYPACRGRLSTIVHNGIASVADVNMHALPDPVVLATTRKTLGSMSSRSFSYRRQERSSHRNRSPSPQHRRGAVVKVMSPKTSHVSTQRTYGTAPLPELVKGGLTWDSPIRHTMYHSLHEASSFQNLLPQEDYDEWNNQRGYVSMNGAVETVISTPAASTANVATTDMDMDLVSDDEEWFLPLAVSSAEEVLAMMHTSYYHASYQANSREDVDGGGGDNLESS